MKKIFMYSLLFFVLVSLLMTACKEEIVLRESVRHFTSVAELRSKYQGESVTLTSGNSNSHLFVGGIVISNPGSGNTPEGKVIIQNSADGQLRGITLSIEGLYNRYLEGDSIIADIEGATLERVDGMLQVSGLTTLEVGRISTGNERKVNLSTQDFGILATGRDIYENTLIRLLDADVIDVTRNQVFGDEDVTLSDGTHTVLVKTRENAAVAGSLVPLSANFTGIVFYTATDEPYLSLRSSADVDNGQYMGPEFYPNFPETFNEATSRKQAVVTNNGEDHLFSGIWHYAYGSSTNTATVRRIGNTGFAAWFAGSGQQRAEAKLEMWFDLEFGASEFSFYYAPATVNAADQNAVTLVPEYSQDEGVTWQPVDPSEPNGFSTGQGSTDLYGTVAAPVFAEYKRDNLGIEGKVRFRIRRPEIPAPAAGGRWVIDDIFIKPHE